MLATGASVNLVLEPIYSNAVWGAGWYNAGTAHYADNAIRYEGNVDVELQMGAGGAIWDFLAKWIVAERAWPKSLDISPDGARVYQYHALYDPSVPPADNPFATSPAMGAWNTSASFSTSQGSFVTASMGVVAISREEVDPAGGTSFSDYGYLAQKKGVVGADCTVFNTTGPLNPSGYNVNPIPYWRSDARILTGVTVPFTGGADPQSGTETVEWSVDVSQNNLILYTCDGDRLPTAVLQGIMDSTGSVTLYNEGGVYDPILGPNGTGSLTNPFLYAANTTFRIGINTVNTAGTYLGYIELPAVVVESDTYDISDANSVTNRAFGIKGLAGKCHSSGHAMPACIISDSAGAYISPDA